MAKKKTLKRSTAAPAARAGVVRRPARGLLDALDQADTLMQRERWPEARDLLADLARRYPNEAEVWGKLVDVNYALNDLHGYQSAAEHLLALNPREHDLRPALAAGICRTGCPRWRCARCASF